MNTTTAVYNLGVASAALDDYVEAQRYYDRAISTWERTLSGDNAAVARALAAKAELLAAQGLNSEAKILFERALAIREKVLVKNHRDIARTLMFLAMTEAKLGRLPRALELSTRATAIWEQSNERATRRASDALVTHGTLLAARGDYAAARSAYENALVIRRRIAGASHPTVADVQANLSEALANEWQSAEALEHALSAEEIVRAHQRLTLRALPERQALAFAAKRSKGLDVALTVTESEPAVSDRVLDRVIRSRALVLDEIAGRQHGSADASQPEIAPLRDALTAARQRLANLVVKGPGQQRPEQYLALVEEARREKERAETALAEKSAPFRAELAKEDIGLRQVSAALPTRSAMVSLVRYDKIVLSDKAGPVGTAGPSTPRSYPAPTTPSYLAFVLRAGEQTPVAVPLGSAKTIDDLVSRWRTELMAGFARTPSSPRTAERSLRAVGTRLRQHVWDPIAKELQDAVRVFIVPDGGLNLMPFAALPTGDNAYLLESGQVLHYLSAERDLLAPENISSAGHGLLALGGPSFDDASLFAALTRPKPRGPAASRSTAVPEGDGKERALRGSNPTCLNLQELQFDLLPATGREAQGVAELWRESAAKTSSIGGSSVTLAGRDANERSLKELGPGHLVLHLATHGFFLGGDCLPKVGSTRSVGGLTTVKKRPAGTRQSRATSAPMPTPTATENPLLLSGLALAGANRRMAAGPDEEDGILTAEEVASLNLSGVEWAVLSACDTGLGEIKAGEGVFGLRRAFQVAGARTVIMSLWSVEDRSAMEWMRALYDGRLRRNLDTADAVREASLTILRQRRQQSQNTHPFFWAGFVASGDWR